MDHVKLGEMMTPYGIVSVMRGTYLRPDGPIAVWLDREDGERIAVLSVNLENVGVDTPPDHFWFWRSNLSTALIQAVARFPGFEGTGRRVKVGPYRDIEAELWRIV